MLHRLIALSMDCAIGATRFIAQRVFELLINQLRPPPIELSSHRLPACHRAISSCRVLELSRFRDDDYLRGTIVNRTYGIH